MTNSWEWQTIEDRQKVTYVMRLLLGINPDRVFTLQFFSKLSTHLNFLSISILSHHASYIPPLSLFLCGSKVRGTHGSWVPLAPSFYKTSSPNFQSANSPQNFFLFAPLNLFSAHFLLRAAHFSPFTSRSRWTCNHLSRSEKKNNAQARAWRRSFLKGLCRFSLHCLKRMQRLKCDRLNQFPCFLTGTNPSL